MATMNISLPDELKAFVKDQATKRGFGTVSQYMSAIIREQQAAGRASGRGLTPCSWKGSSSGPATPLTQKDWEHIRRKERSLSRSGSVAAMNRAIIKLPRAETDLIGCYTYLGEQASIETADRFLNAVDKTLSLIAKSPGIGAPHETNHPQLTELRSLPVSKFKRYVLYYQAFDDRIEVVRVLHGARDIRRILDAAGDDDVTRHSVAPIRPARVGWIESPIQFDVSPE